MYASEAHASAYDGARWTACSSAARTCACSSGDSRRDVSEATQDRLVRRQLIGGFRSHDRGHRADQRAIGVRDCRDDFFGELVVEVEPRSLARLAIVGLGPQALSRRGVGQLRHDPHHAAGGPDRALQHVSGGHAFGRSVARDEAQVAESRETDGDALRQAVGELGGVATLARRRELEHRHHERVGIETGRRLRRSRCRSRRLIGRGDAAGGGDVFRRDRRKRVGERQRLSRPSTRRSTSGPSCSIRVSIIRACRVSAISGLTRLRSSSAVRASSRRWSCPLAAAARNALCAARAC